MKRLSIIMSAVLMAIFFTACSGNTPLEVTNDNILFFNILVDPNSQTPTLSYTESEHSTIDISSKEGKQSITIPEKYDIRQYAKYHIPRNDMDYPVGSLQSFTYTDGYIFSDYGIAFRTNGKVLALVLPAVLDAADIKINSIKYGHISTRENKAIPSLVIDYNCLSSHYITYIPILEPKEYAPEHGRNNLEELINSGKLKCAKLISE